MAYNPPTDELIKFLETGVKDVFPTAYDAGNSSIAEKYTKVWAEYHNKIRNFIGIMEPFCSTDTAENQGLKGLSYWTLNPAPLLLDIYYGAAKAAIDLGQAPPTNVFPFEIIITSSTDDYSKWHKQAGTGGSVPMLYQTSSANIDKIAFGTLSTLKPMVQCSIRGTIDGIYSTRWNISHYCINGTDTLAIRGAIIDTNCALNHPVTNSLPNLTHSFPNASLHRMQVTLVGARP